MSDRHTATFEVAVAPHLSAAFNLAHWLIRDDHAADDALQEAYQRAFRFFSGFSGGNVRAWLLTIVRNSCYTWLTQHRTEESFMPLETMPPEVEPTDAGPETLLIQAESARWLQDALASIQTEFREAFVLREMEGLSYKEIAEVAGVPMGTVMSRLSRARRQLQQALLAMQAAEVGP